MGGEIIHRIPPGQEERSFAALSEVAQRLLTEVHPEAKRPEALSPASSLERDLGLDSLSRMELVTRVEAAFAVNLPDGTLGAAETLGDLLQALQAAGVADRVAPSADLRRAPAEAAEPAPTSSATLLDALDWHVGRHPDRVQITHLADEGEEEITYARLRLRAGAVAAGLQARGLAPDQTVAIMLPTGPEYFYTYFGVLLAGGVPVPIYPPARLSQIEEHVRRHTAILANAACPLLVTVPEARPVARLLEARVGDLRRVVTVPELVQEGGEPARVPRGAGDIAFLQYTSGSTGHPKGVVLTHANLLANIRAIGEAIEVKPEDVFVSWLPLYHDMGLISVWLASLYFANPMVVMSPLAFLARPVRWLSAIDRYRGTISAAPNFGYELCVKRIEDRQIEGVDLSSWRIAGNGAEPVLPNTIQRFTERFATLGFRPEAMMPVYGLAECTVGLLCPPLGRRPVVDRIQRAAFVRSGKALPAPPEDPNPLHFVACGRPLPGHHVRIVDEAGREVGERAEGRLEFQGPSSTRGYYRNPDDTRRLLDGEWLDTGDRAYAAGEDVYLTGRVKDIIIRGGRNIYPHELEDAVGGVAGVRRGCVAVFGSPDPDSGTERLVVLAEAKEGAGRDPDAVREAIIGVTVDVLGEPPDEVVLAPPHTVLKTSSGKLRRAASRHLYEAGLGRGKVRGVPWQVMRLLGGSILPQARRWLGTVTELSYGLYGWAVFWLVAPLTWLAVALTLRPDGAWTICRGAARLLLRVTGTGFRVNGSHHLPRGRAFVLVANHASYLDGMALFAACPTPLRFVAKREFQQDPVARRYLEHLGAHFVERFDVQESVQDADRLGRAAGAGGPLAFFPEGTFRRTTGLQAFHLGAFVAAATAGVPVVPVAIRGTRSMLPDNQRLPRRGTVEVTIGRPIDPPADGADTFASAIGLRDAARAEILRHCGEPDAAGSAGAPPA